MDEVMVVCCRWRDGTGSRDLIIASSYEGAKEEYVNRHSYYNKGRYIRACVEYVEATRDRYAKGIESWK
jgi:hypothetical protein